MRRIAGVELGGTKCVALLAGEDGEVVARETVPTALPDETLPRLREILEGWEAAAALGIAAFGPLDLRPGSATWGHVTTTPKPGWRMADVAGALGNGFPGPVGFDTDVNGAALAEMRWGAGRGMADFAYVTVGTGVGVGLVVDGRPTRGFGHSELGHVRVRRAPGDDWPGACPYHGACVEGLAAGGSISARVGEAAADLPEGHPVWETVADALAQLCHVIVCTSAPRRIAIGGGVVSRRPSLLPRIEAKLVESLAGYVALPEGPYVVAPGLGNLAGPLGAVAVGLEALRSCAASASSIKPPSDKQEGNE